MKEGKKRRNENNEDGRIDKETCHQSSVVVEDTENPVSIVPP